MVLFKNVNMMIQYRAVNAAWEIVLSFLVIGRIKMNVSHLMLWRNVGPVQKLRRDLAKMAPLILAHLRTLLEMTNVRLNVKRDLVHGEGENVFPKKETLTVEREPEVTKGHAILEQMILAWIKTRSEQLVVLFPHVLQVIYFLLTQNTKTIKGSKCYKFSPNLQILWFRKTKTGK